MAVPSGFGVASTSSSASASYSQIAVADGWRLRAASSEVATTVPAAPRGSGMLAADAGARGVWEPNRVTTAVPGWASARTPSVPGRTETGRAARATPRSWPSSAEATAARSSERPARLASIRAAPPATALLSRCSASATMVRWASSMAVWLTAARSMPTSAVRAATGSIATASMATRILRLRRREPERRRRRRGMAAGHLLYRRFRLGSSSRSRSRADEDHPNG